MNNSSKLILTVAAICVVGIGICQWDSSIGKLPAVKSEKPKQVEGKSAVSPNDFMNEVLKQISIPDKYVKLLSTEPSKLQAKDWRSFIIWTIEANQSELYAYANSQLAININNMDTIAAAALFNAGLANQEKSNNNTYYNYFLGLSNTLSEMVLNKNPNQIDARLAKVLYVKATEPMPMKFLGLLKETYNLDSSNLNTLNIYTNLLIESNQLPKALQKAKKLVSLQPKNPESLFLLSNVYGLMGDSASAKTYLKMAKSVSK